MAIMTHLRNWCRHTCIDSHILQGLYIEVVWIALFESYWQETLSKFYLALTGLSHCKLEFHGTEVGNQTSANLHEWDFLVQMSTHINYLNKLCSDQSSGISTSIITSQVWVSSSHLLHWWLHHANSPTQTAHFSF